MSFAGHGQEALPPCQPILDIQGMKERLMDRVGRGGLEQDTIETLRFLLG